jgi:PAS domain S-box-containing protein
MTDESATKSKFIPNIKKLSQKFTGIISSKKINHPIEKELLEKNIFLQNIIESSSSISIVSTDLDRNILYWNSGAENIFGYTSEEMVGKQKIDSLYADEESKEKIRKTRYDLFNKKKSVTCEIKEVTKNGREVWIRLTLTPRLDDKRNVIGILGIGEDITEHKWADENLQISLEKFQKLTKGVIDTLVSTIESRDPYTAGHQKRVAYFAKAIANELKLSKEIVDGIHMASLIHDLGKIAVPSEILSNPGTLSDVQFNMIKIHPEVGYDILKNIEFQWPLDKIVLQHHERVDGTGYPSKLKGDEILLESKILAVADTVEAMVSHRPYRAALGVNAALEEITKMKGVYYDADVVDACLRLSEKGEFKID